MRLLDPADGVVERFACELRALRAAAGELPFWKMARRCEVSKSALAAAVAGHELPSERVARAFVQVCGGDWAWWRARLAQARTQLAAAADAPLVGGAPPETPSAALEPVRRMLPVQAVVRGDLAVRAGSPSSLPVPPAENRSGGSWRRARWRRVYRRHPVIVPALAALVILAAAAMAVPPSSPQSTPTRPPAALATAVSPSSTPRSAPPSPPSPSQSPSPTQTGLPAAVDLVRVVPYAGEDDSHVTAQPLSLTADQLGRLNAAKAGDPAHQAWFTAQGAVDVDATVVQIIVEGNRGHLVRIVDIQPVVTCAAPLTGTLFLSPSQGGDRTTQLFVDLDSPRRTLAYSILGGNGLVTTGEDYFGNYTVSLAQGEQQTFELKATSEKHYCTFTLNMTVVDGAQTVVEHISDDGRPFAVSALVLTAGHYSSYRALYVGGVFAPDGWVREDPATFTQ